MNKDLLKRIMIRNSLIWAMAMVLPVSVMIVLDLFDLHTPSRVGLWGSLSLFVPFWLSHQYLSRQLGRLVPETREQP